MPYLPFTYYYSHIIYSEWSSYSSLSRSASFSCCNFEGTVSIFSKFLQSNSSSYSSSPPWSSSSWTTGISFLQSLLCFCELTELSMGQMLALIQNFKHTWLLSKKKTYSTKEVDKIKLNILGDVNTMTLMNCIHI